ncbi:hypothetical protein HOY82DRAFT_614788 [Tuber indicum]|nr:hypothetical protein HOY82DRAFT_614788 [Tuber indicum]
MISNTTMYSNHSHQRNYTFYDATHPDVALGGLLLNGCITEANFLDILRILLVVPGGLLSVQQWILDNSVSRTDIVLKIGLLIPPAIIQVSDGPWTFRLTSQIAPVGEDQFCHVVCHRDRRLVISGLSNPEHLIQANNWTGFEGVHIFPSEHQSLWIESDYQWWITDVDDATGSLKINQPQNGFRLEGTV